ncbi:unnamed protein product [Adineta steineri]|uniref:ADP ribosyltransferase domain-containing protein n=1 Tax=Adineta steineri TaxID=433720 RepID=A0A818T2B5_9BILA|nr:unnamed protein product [Adineta steineri]CAF3678968.1 unnamed protein product [Adineta steineri]
MATPVFEYGNNLETICLVWLDAVVNTSQDNINAQQQFRQIINHLETFQNVQDCKQYLQQTSNDDRIFLIVSGRLGHEIVPQVHSYRQISSIYVYCMDKKRNEEWAKHFTKVKGVFIRFDQLKQQIQSEQLKRMENKVDEPFLMTMTKLNDMIDKSTNELNGEFLQSQLLIDCLVRMKPNLTDKTELINICKNIYANNLNELNLIKEFEDNYRLNQAIWWYTRESFLYRLLNKALRINNIDLLFLFRFFIRDIQQQLKRCQCLLPVRVYRAQLMSTDELNQLKNSLGEYISVNSFFSTSLNRQKAIKFLRDDSFPSDLQKVLFEIDANSESDYSKVYSNISSISYYSNEQEILFTLGSIFRLLNIKQESNGLWVIQMILSNHNDENIKILFNNIKDEYSGINNETSLLSFGNILHQMGKYDLAEKYFHRLINELPNDHDDISRCYHALGVLALLKDNYDVSLNWHEKSIEKLKSNDVHLADNYNCIGCIYQKKEDFPKALDFYNKALDIWTKTYGEDYYKIADCLNNMGCVYEIEKNYLKALEYHQKSLSIRQKCLPKYHSDLGASYNNIGNIYLRLQQYDLALENYKSSYEIKLKSLPSQHISLAATLENIALVYEQKHLYEQALSYYEKVATIFHETYSSTHNSVIQIEQDIQRVSSLINSQMLTAVF